MSRHDDPADVARARLARDQDARRAAFQREQAARLAGSRIARDRLADDWAAVVPDHTRTERLPLEGP
jgi:hypothetical protein